MSLGDLDAARDWGYAGDFVNAMWLMLQQEVPDDYILATGVSHTIRELLDTAFSHVGLHWQNYVKIDERFNRPADACQLLGNPASAEADLGWKRSVDFQQLIRLMVDSDLKRTSNK